MFVECVFDDKMIPGTDRNRGLHIRLFKLRMCTSSWKQKKIKPVN